MCGVNKYEQGTDIGKVKLHSALSYRYEVALLGDGVVQKSSSTYCWLSRWDKISIFEFLPCP